MLDPPSLPSAISPPPSSLVHPPCACDHRIPPALSLLSPVDHLSTPALLHPGALDVFSLLSLPMLTFPKMLRLPSRPEGECVVYADRDEQSFASRRMGRGSVKNGEGGSPTRSLTAAMPHSIAYHWSNSLHIYPIILGLSRGSYTGLVP